MNFTDSRGLCVTTRSAAALERYEEAARQTHGYVGNPLATLDEALAEDPDFAMAHALRADLAAMSSEQGALPLIRSSVEALARIGNRANWRERAHVAAASAWMEGRFESAVQLYGAIVIEYPQDLVALQTAHVMDFYLGDSPMLRDRPAQVLPHWHAEVPGFGYLLGMHAFGLEETANYSRAEDVGRRALDLNARDPWAVHAVQHVFEMQGRVHDGIQWLNATAPHWSDSALSFHNWWHLALHQLELDDFEAALDTYDRLVHPNPSVVALELVDASQLLWRIALRGGDVGPRWLALADCWAAPAERGFYVFNDLHALMAYASAGRHDEVRRMLATLEGRAAAADTNGAVTRDVGLPLARAIVAFSEARYADAVELLLPIRSRAQCIGGSHAQRDLVQLTCIEAALRSGSGRLARALASERTEQKPANPFNWRLAARSLEIEGDLDAARAAAEHAEIRRRAQLRRAAA
ncbi:MAG: tetratricopeptide repeat protein [Steroidobacteraceae bacterium]